MPRRSAEHLRVLPAAASPAGPCRQVHRGAARQPFAIL